MLQQQQLLLVHQQREHLSRATMKRRTRERDEERSSGQMWKDEQSGNGAIQEFMGRLRHLLCLPHHRRDSAQATTQRV